MSEVTLHSLWFGSQGVGLEDGLMVYVWLGAEGLRMGLTFLPASIPPWPLMA